MSEEARDKYRVVMAAYYVLFSFEVFSLNWKRLPCIPGQHVRYRITIRAQLFLEGSFSRECPCSSNQFLQLIVRSQISILVSIDTIFQWVWLFWLKLLPFHSQIRPFSSGEHNLSMHVYQNACTEHSTQDGYFAIFALISQRLVGCGYLRLTNGVSRCLVPALRVCERVSLAFGQLQSSDLSLRCLHCCPLYALVARASHASGGIPATVQWQPMKILIEGITRAQNVHDYYVNKKNWKSIRVFHLSHRCKILFYNP